LEQVETSSTAAQTPAEIASLLAVEAQALSDLISRAKTWSAR